MTPPLLSSPHLLQSCLVGSLPVPRPSLLASHQGRKPAPETLNCRLQSLFACRNCFFCLGFGRIWTEIEDSNKTTISTPCIVFKSKAHHRFLNFFSCVIPVPELENRPFMSSNLFSRVIPVPKFRNQPFRSSNLSIYVISVPKLSFKSRSK